MIHTDTGVKSASDRKAMSCPHCQGKVNRHNGRLKGVQRYVCNGCGKNFSETTGKFWFPLKRRAKVHEYLYCLLPGYSIRKSAEETGVAIQTSFNWHHQLPRSFSSVFPTGFEGIVESDNLFFQHSEKGNKGLDRPARKRGGKGSKAGISDEHVAVIATCDRSGNRDFKVVARGRIAR